MALEMLKPVKHQRVMDLLNEVGLDTSDWENFDRGPEWAATNPKYCYEWCFEDREREITVLNLWYSQLSIEEGEICVSCNLQEVAKNSKGVRSKRASKMDFCFQRANRLQLPIRVIICGSNPLKADQKADRRLLDTAEWRIKEYDVRSGDCVLVRKSEKPESSLKTGEERSKIEEAKEFIRSKCFGPALAHPDLDEKYKNKVKYVDSLLNQFQLIGDLYLYIERFNPNVAVEDDWSKATHLLGLQTIEDIYPEFIEKYSDYKFECTRLSDFVVGQTYQSHEIRSYAGMYDARSGGILPIEKNGEVTAIFIMANLDGTGPYPNKWISPGEVLKYYMKAIGGVSKPDYKDNDAVINSGSSPIYVFEKIGTNCTLLGAFKYDSHEVDETGSPWFRLIKANNFDLHKTVAEKEYFDNFDLQIEKSRAESSEERRRRLKTANKTPRKIKSISTVYERNADVVVEVLQRAKGICERCRVAAPFIRRKDSTPYLEVHHKKMLSEGGEDTVANAIAICPNCHRELHFGKIS